MAILSNINDKFAVDSTGAIQFNGQAGTSGYVLKSNGNAAPTWVDASTVIGGPYLPLSGGTLTGATATASGISFTVGGALSAGVTTITSDTGLRVYSSTNAVGANVTFSDVTNRTQLGFIKYFHENTASYGSAHAFVITGDQTTMTILADGKLMYKEGVYLKPATGTGAGTRKDNLWDAAYNDKITGLAVTGTTTKTLTATQQDGGTLTATWTDNDSGGTVTGTGANTQVAFWTGTSVIDGSSDLRWDNTNKELGIGRNPDYSLDIYNSSGTTSSATGTTMQRLWNYVGGDLSQQKTFIDFVFQDDNDNEYPQVRIGAEVGQNSDANTTIKEGSGAFVVYTNNATGSTPGTNSLTERMRVDYAGNVGIGTTTPGASLDIEPSSGDADILLTAGSQTLRLDQNSIRTTTNNNLTLFTNGNSGQLVLQQSTGNVGIGNTNPSRNLTLGNGSGNSVLAIVASTTGLSQIGLGDTDDDNYGQIILRHSDGVLQIQNGGGGGITERGLNITSSENVGIGTTTPDAKLEVIATRTGTPSSDTNIKVTDDTAQAADVGGSINFTGKYTDAGVVLSGSPFIRASKKNATTGDYGYGLKFGVRGSGSSTSNVAMTIDSDSNVGIGTTSPDTLLHVYNPDTNWGAYSVITLGTDVEGTNQAQLKYYRGASTATESFQLSVRGTTALTALYNGRVGLGENSPADKLDVNGAILCNNRVQIDGVDDVGNVTGSVDSLRATGYGLMGNRTGNIYITNGNSDAGAKIVLGVRGAHNGNNKLVIGDTLSYFNNNKLLINKTVDDGGQLQVASSTTSGSIRIGGANGVGQSRVYIESNGNNSYIDSFGGNAYQNLGIQAAIIKLQTTSSSSRRVDLGTQTWAGYGSNPIARFNIEVNGGNALNIYNTQENDAYLRFIDSQSNGSQYAYFAFNSSTNYFTINNMGNNAITLKNNGYVGINNTDPTYRLHVKNSNNVSIFEDTSDSSGASFIVFNRPGVFAMGSITRNGSANSVAYNTGSDYRLKEDLKDFNALDLVNNITAYDYKWKDVDQRDYGFIAHELKQTLPNVVTGEKDGEKMQGVDYSKLTPILLKAIQELEARVKELENK